MRFARTEPADCPVNGSIVKCDMSLECPGQVTIGWKGIKVRSIFEPSLPHELCNYPIRSQQTITRPSPYTITNARRVACINAPIMHSSCFEIFSHLLTWNYFVGSILSHEMHYELCWIVASIVLLDSKNIADAIVCACKELLRNLSE